MIKLTQLAFEDVKTEVFGELMTIRVNASSIKTYSRKVELLKKIDSMKLSADDATAYSVAADLMSICTDPKTGKHSFEPKQLTNFVDNIPFELFNDLSKANMKVNPADFSDAEEVKTLTAKKKST